MRWTGWWRPGSSWRWSICTTRARCCASISRAAATSRSAFPRRNDALLDTGGGVVKALPHFEGEPFFILNSDSIWVEGYRSALAAMNQAWDAERMDGLLLLASMTTALGYEGGGAISACRSTGHVARVPERMRLGLRLSRRADRPSPPVRRSAGGNLLHQHDVGPRHRPGPALRHSAGRRVDACGHAPRRATTPRHSWPGWKKVERHLHDRRLGAVRRDIGARIDGADGSCSKCAFALSDVTIYLPTRRAARNFGEAFARVLGGAALLPQFRAAGRQR